MLWVWTGSLCSWMPPPTCHLLLPKHWAHVPKETWEHRDPLVITELALSSSLPLQCAIWCMVLINAHCQACFSPMYGGKIPILRGKRLSLPPSAFVLHVRQVKLCFSCKHAAEDQCQGSEGAGHQFQRYETLSVFPNINHRSPCTRVQMMKPGLRINEWMQFSSS